MKFIFFLIVIFTSWLLEACAPITVPQIGSPVPCQIQSIEQVKQAVIEGLAAQHWKIIFSSDHLIQAEKTSSSSQAVIQVAYGYRGFSIEYFDSKNMDYDSEKDTIDSTYKKWVYHLMSGINKILNQQVKSLPPVKCSSLKDQYQQEE